MTDERLEEALRRAAVPVMRTSLTEADDLRAGWAEAVKLLDCWHQEAYEDSDGSELMPPVMHDGICDAACGDPCKPCRARGSFIRAMLGEE